MEALKITKNKNDENVPHLEIIEVVSVHCNFVNKDYQQDSRALYTFVPNKTFSSLSFKSEFQTIRVLFRDQNSQPLEVEDEITLKIR